MTAELVLCGGCRYWRPDEPERERAVGLCAMAATSEGEPEHPENDPARLVFRAMDGEEYRASLVTDAEFGCVAGVPAYERTEG